MTNVSKIIFNGETLDIKDTHAREQIQHLTADNYKADVTGDYTVNAGDIAMNSKNATMHTTADRTIDTDGNDSVHIDGASTLNVGGLRTETFSGDKTETVTGTVTEKFNNVNTTVSGEWMVNLPSRSFDMANVALKTDTPPLPPLPFVQPEQFGAKGDGVTDDTLAIQTAVNTGFTIVFNVATYLITSAINVGTNKHILGITRGTPVIKCVNCNGFNITGKNTILQNLEIQNANTGINIGDGKTSQDCDASIKDVNVKYSKIGFQNNVKSRSANFYDCYANGCDYGFMLSGTDCKILNCAASVTKYHGFAVTSANNVLENCKAFFCGSVKTNESNQTSSGFYITGNYTNGINLMSQQNYYYGLYINASYCAIDAHSDADGKANKQEGDSYGMFLDGTKNIVEFTCVGGRNIDGELFTPDVGIKLGNHFDKCILNLLLTSLSSSSPMQLFDIADWHYNNGFIIINGTDGNMLNLNNPAPLKRAWSVDSPLINIPELQIKPNHNSAGVAMHYDNNENTLDIIDPTSRRLKQMRCGSPSNDDDNNVVTIRYLKDKGLIH